jgi:hypothetical protein
LSDRLINLTISIIVENNAIKCDYFSFVLCVFPKRKLLPLKNSIITDLGEFVCAIMVKV